MGAADQLLAKAGEQAERALAADDESAAIAAAAAAARLALRGILADRGKPTPDDVSPACTHLKESKHSPDSPTRPRAIAPTPSRPPAQRSPGLRRR